MQNDPFGWLGGIGNNWMDHPYGYYHQNVANMESQMMQMQAGIAGDLAARQRALSDQLSMQGVYGGESVLHRLSDGPLSNIEQMLAGIANRKPDYALQWEVIRTTPASGRAFFMPARRPWWHCNPWLITGLTVAVELWRIVR